MPWQFIIWGFLIKTVASIDDTATKLPILIALTRTRKGKIAFAVGNIIAVAAAIAVAILISGLLHELRFFRYLAAALIATIAFIALFSRKKTTAKITPPTTSRLVSLVGSGFVVSLFTVMDDTALFIPIFAIDTSTTVFTIIGIFLSTILNLYLVIIFAEKLAKLKYMNEFAFTLLIIFAVLVFFGVV